MNIKQIKKILTDSGIEQNEAKIEAKMLLQHFSKATNSDLIFSQEFEDNDIILEKAKQRAETKVPIQYIIGFSNFMNENFIVNEHVLIPRDETEILVNEAIKKLEAKEKQNTLPLKVLDIGTGSGCIACIIAKKTSTEVLGVDISIDALQVALNNSSRLGLFNKATFRKSNLFSNIRKKGMGAEKFDLIISNPPYIPLSEESELQTEVYFEPNSALFAPDKDGVEFYKKITEQSMEYLHNSGYLMFELGIGQAEKVKCFMKQAGFKNIEIINDLAYIERVIIGEK